MTDFTLAITGTTPLLMHSSRLADPLDPATKAIKKVSGKAKKTDDDHEEMARLEHAGSLYFDSEIGPYLPSENVFRALWDAAKKYKLGVKVKEGVLITTSVNPLIYHGPRTIEGLWDDKSFVHRASVKVGMSRVMRTRPIFREWRTEVEGVFDPSILDPEQLEQITDTAGALIGLGDWRPFMGRFETKLEIR